MDINFNQNLIQMKYLLIIPLLITLSCNSSKEEQPSIEASQKIETNLDPTSKVERTDLQEITIPLPETFEFTTGGETFFYDNIYEEFTIYIKEDGIAIGLSHTNERISLYFVKENGVEKWVNPNGFPVTVYYTYSATEPDNDCVFSLMDESANPRYLSFICDSPANVIVKFKI